MTFDLNKRAYGEWFAPFERELIFLKQEEHIGWVEYTSRSTFKLKLTPFYGAYRKFEYIVTDPKTMPLQDRCIEVKPFKIIHDPIFNAKNLYGKYQNYCIIDGYSDYKIELQKLSIGYKDFLYHVSSSWLNAEEDNLDTMLALQMVSCPSSFYGVGGIGAAAAKISKGKLSTSIIPELNKTYKNIVAENFQKMNDKYMFNMAKTSTDRKHINNLRQVNLPEVNYCCPCGTIDEAQKVTETIPIQIPMLVKGATYENASKLAEPYFVLQYQLTAFMHNPTFGGSNSALKEIEDNIRLMSSCDLPFNFDANTVNKLALAFNRFYLTEDNSAIKIKEAVKTFFAYAKDWHPYIKESAATTKFRCYYNPTDMIINFSNDHQKFLTELQKLHDETKRKWIAWDELKNKFEEKKWHILDEIAIELNNLGFIIHQYNFSQIRKVDIL